MNTDHSWAISLKRWIWVISYALVAACLAIPLASLIDRTLISIFSAIDNYSPELADLFRLAALGVSALVIRWKTGTTFLQMKNALYWPPAVVGVPIGLTVLASFLWLSGHYFSLSSKTVEVIPILFGLSALIGLCQGALGNWVQSHNIIQTQCIEYSESSNPVDIEELANSQLIDWLNDESPITNPSRDMFRAREKAQRLLAVLREKRSLSKNHYKTIVIEGPYGSGKSTIVKLLENEALLSHVEKPQLIFTRVNCWGFSSVAAQEHILEQSIIALSKYADCLSVRHVPSAYVNALGEASSWLGAVANTLAGNRSPLDILNELTPILGSINARLIITIEDTDRNGSDFDQKQIEAMLHSFRDVERLSFILTAGNKSQIDFSKIAEYTLYIQKIPRNIVLRILENLRVHCIKDHQFINPVPDHLNLDNLTLTEFDSFPFNPLRSDLAWFNALTKILDRPRLIKQVFRKVIHVWKHLVGEVTIDDLIIVTALKEAAPSILDFYARYKYDFERLQSASEQTNEPERHALSDIRMGWLNAVESSQCDSAALRVLLAELTLHSKWVTGQDPSAFRSDLQAIKGSRGDVYWQRICDEMISAYDARDQEALVAMAFAKDDLGSMAAKMAESSNFTESVIYFQRGTVSLDVETGYRVSSLALQLLRPFSYNNTGVLNGRVKSILNLVRSLTSDSKGLIEWLISEMQCKSRWTLKDALELFRYFREDIWGEDYTNIRNSFIASLEIRMEGICRDDFVKTFLSEDLTDIRNFLRFYRNYPDEDSASLVLSKVGRLLVESMRNGEDIALAQAIRAVGDFAADDSGNDTFTINMHALKMLFEYNSDEVLREIVSYSELEASDKKLSLRKRKASGREASRILNREGTGESTS